MTQTREQKIDDLRKFIADALQRAHALAQLNALSDLQQLNYEDGFERGYARGAEDAQYDINSGG
jgi:hypothetical protein